MIIFGSRGLTSVVETNQFHCPQCGTMRTGSLKQVRNFFTLYFIPLIPMGIAGRYIECDSCGGTYGEEILSYDPEVERQETQTQMLRVMVMAALADGEVDEDERRSIATQYQQFAGLPLAPATLDNEIAMARSSGANLNTYVGSFVENLSPHGKALVVSFAFHTMTASALARGQLQPGHQDQLTQLGKTLQIPDDQYVELIKQLSEPDEDDGESPGV